MRLLAKNFKTRRFDLPAVLLLSTLISIAGCKTQPPTTATDTAVQTTFATPADAGQTLRSAVQGNDQAALTRILGHESSDILNSGDPKEDEAARDSFQKKYDRMNRWVPMTDGSQFLYIGADNYTFPIPLVRNSSSQWYFNTAAGKDEILARRIGKNELLAIDACNAIADAEELYFRTVRVGNSGHQFTSLIISSAGKQDGLYWDAANDQDSSPLGTIKDFVKDDTAPSTTANQPRVFDGYSFRILDAQGAQAKGGAKSYIVGGKMTGGFAVIASPVKYRDSGVMTFIMNRQGTVYQKDLGTNTAELAGAIKEFNPADGWVAAQ